MVEKGVGKVGSKNTEMLRADISFKEVGDNRVFVAFTKAGYGTAMALLKQNGLKAMTLEVASAKISENPELIDLLMSHHNSGNVFYLDSSVYGNPPEYVETAELVNTYIFDGENKSVKDKNRLYFKTRLHNFNEALDDHMPFVNVVIGIKTNDGASLNK